MSVLIAVFFFFNASLTWNPVYSLGAFFLSEHVDLLRVLSPPVLHLVRGILLNHLETILAFLLFLLLNFDRCHDSRRRDVNRD